MDMLLDRLLRYWKPALEIALLGAGIYFFLKLFRRTRGAAVFTGLVIALVVVGGITRVFELNVLSWIFGHVLTWLAIALLVIFQPELRRALAQIGSQQIFTGNQRGQFLVDVLVETARSLSQKRCGGLMAIERDIGFRGVIETGVPIGARASAELLTTIFFPNTPLHDGGVVLRGDQIVAASCVFPLSQQHDISKSLGMRHRAAVGLTEETDAVVVVVSEQTGEISVAQQGHLMHGMDLDGLRSFLQTALAPSREPGPTGWIGDVLQRTIRRLMSPQEGFSDVSAQTDKERSRQEERP
jgi:diadenylate cyclase